MIGWLVILQELQGIKLLLVIIRFYYYVETTHLQSQSHSGKVGFLLDHQNEIRNRHSW